jgi:hypothetical protein
VDTLPDVGRDRSSGSDEIFKEPTSTHLKIVADRDEQALLARVIVDRQKRPFRALGELRPAVVVWNKTPSTSR